VIPKSLTFSSSVTHWVRESSSLMKDAMSLRAFLVVVGTFFEASQHVFDNWRPIGGQAYMIGCRKGAVWSPDLAAGVLQAFKSLLSGGDRERQYHETKACA